ncbi:TPA: hypothetical protein ACHY2P_006395 [Pseudomonas aeruginosa]|uniref:hypothetical protein n=1 Tax=Pseudomonas aeruginosa TaxID=287 RepID=UPI0011C0EECA|nr:hypothetical protein [Pseudomonas aeruginosa]NPX94510.1 hypothetical protein [Pseudomonas aeruginosa]
MTELETALRKLSDARATLTERAEISELARHLRKEQKALSLGANDKSPALPDKPGIYYLEARFKFSTAEELAEFGERWGRIRAEAHEGNIPRYYPTRAKHHLRALAAGKPIPFYLGKRESIADRIASHIESPLSSGTYALKLRARPQLLNDLELTYSYRAFDVPLTSYYGVELIEGELRKLLNPILGKQ